MNMDNDISYEVKTKITSLSTKLKCLKNAGAFSPSTIKDIFFKKIKYCLPLLMTEIIRNLEFVDKSKDKFIALIEEYNKEKNTNLDFSDFENICWIRIVNNEIQIPARIDHLMWSLNSDYDKEIVAIPVEKMDIVLCLLRYYKHIYGKRAKITSDKINTLLNNYNLKNDAISYLIEKDILEYEENDNSYLWGTEEHFPVTLNDEIASLLWLLEKDESNLTASFSRYYSLLIKVHIELNDLSNYLSSDDCLTLFLQSKEYLKNETDLINSDKEVCKIWYDSDCFSHRNIFGDVPTLNFNEADTYSLLKKIKNQNSFWRLEDCIYMQKTRYFCFSLLKYIILHEMKNNYSFGNTIREIIKDVSRPSLIFEFLFIIERIYPEILPWFHIDPDLSPVALNILHEFIVNTNFFTNDALFFNKYEKQLSLKYDLWLESFDIVLTNIAYIWRTNIADHEQIGKSVARIFLDLSNKIFTMYLSTNSDNILWQRELFRTYSESLKRLNNIKTDLQHFNNDPVRKQILFPFLFQHIIRYIIGLIKKLNILERNSLIFHFEYFDISIDFIRNVNNLYNTEKQDDSVKQINDNLEGEIISLLSDNLIQYLYIENNNKQEKLWFGFDTAKLDYIDWGYFFILLYKYNLLTKFNHEFTKSIIIDVSGDRYTVQNHNQIGKVIMFLRIIFFAYLSLKKERTDLYAIGVKIVKVSDFLERFITKHAIFYSIDKFGKGRVDAYDDFPSVDMYKREKPLIELLFDSMNYMKINTQTKLVKDLFNNSINLKRMLSAMNIINDVNIKNVISNYIRNIDIEKFVDSCFYITDIENALFQALYNDQHWEIAGSLISRIKEHYATRNIRDEQVHYLLYQADLLLALRKKDLKALQSVEYVKKEYYSREYKIQELKQFYIAIHMMDNKKDYSKAANILKNLLLSDPHNTNYGLNYFKASVFEVLNQAKLNIENINISYRNWTNFLDNLEKEKETFISGNIKDINYYSLPFYIVNKKTVEFDNTIKYLRNEHKYHELLLKLIGEFYFERNLESEAYNYLVDANNFYTKMKIKIPAYIKNNMTKYGNRSLYELKQSFNKIITTYYENIPKIVPDNINNKTELNKFILTEIVYSLRQMIIKIQTVKLLEMEDNYTDILQSILKLRFPFYGWSINDHPHVGMSLRKKGPGEPDLVIESSSIPITIIEALKLRGKSKRTIHEHIQKSFNYSKQLKRYYLIIYYNGKKNMFNKTWENYKNNFNLFTFPKKREPSGEFIDLHDEFDNVENFQIAKTKHPSFEMFHIMVDFSIEDD